MKNIIEIIQNKSNNISTSTKLERRTKGAYVDCLCMLQEEQERIEKANSVFTLLVDFKCDRIGINKTATLINKLYKDEE